MQILLYYFGNMFLALILGGLFVTLMNGYDVPRVSSFCMGFSLLPFVLGIYMIVIAIIPYRLSNFLYVSIPYFFAVVYIIFLVKRKKLASIIESLVNSVQYENFEWVIMVVGPSLYSFILCSKTIDAIPAIIINAFFSVAISMVLFYCSKIKVGGVSKTRIVIECVLCFVRGFFYRISFFQQNSNRSFKFALCVFLYFSVIALCLFLIKNSQNHMQSRSAKNITLFELLFLFMFYLRFIGLPLICLKTMIICVLIAIPAFFLMMINNQKNEYKSILYEKENIFEYILVVILTLTVELILIRGLVYVQGSDAIQYLSEAYEYSENMEFGTLNDFHGNESGSLVACIHNPIWPAYLSNGLMYSKVIGYPGDYGARLAFSLSYIYMLSAVFALGYLINGKTLGLLSMVLFFAGRYSFWMIIGSTRDGFRIIPIVQLIILLSCNSSKFKVKSYLLLFLTCFFVMASHPINLITVIPIMIAYVIWLIMEKRCDFGLLLRRMMFCGLGGLLGSYQIIWAYLETHSLTGNYIDYEKLFRNTTYYTTYTRNFAESTGAETGWMMQMKGIISYNWWLIIPALLITAIGIANIKNKRGIERFILLIVGVHLFMFVDLFGWSDHSYVEWCYRNARYTIHLNILWALIVGGVIASWFDKSKGMSGKRIIAYSLLSLVYVSIPLYNIWINSIRDIPERSTYYETLAEITDDLEPRKVLLDNFNMNYYLKDKGLSFWSEPLRSLRAANDDSAFYKETTKLNIGAIIITNAYDEIYWDDTELESFIKSGDYIEKSREIEDLYTVYFLREED